MPTRRGNPEKSMGPSVSARIFALTCAATITLSVANVIAQGFLSTSASDSYRAMTAQDALPHNSRPQSGCARPGEELSQAGL